MATTHKNISSNEIKVKKINTYLSFHIIVLKTDRNKVINQNSLYEEFMITW